MKFSKLFTPRLETGGGFSVEAYVSDAPAPQDAPGGSRLQWNTEADMLQALQEAEDAVGPYLPLLKLAKHMRANNMKIDANLVTKCTADPSSSLDTTSQATVISI